MPASKKSATLEPSYIDFENKIWFVDFSDPGNFRVDIVEPDGTYRPATKSDGDLMEALELGEVITIKEVESKIKR